MGWLDKFCASTAPYHDGDDYWYHPLGGQSTQAGITITSERAAQVAAVHCARSILSETLAHVPLKIYRRLDRGKEVATNHPLYSVLHDRANGIQTSMEWREQLMGDLVFAGNCYALITDGNNQIDLRPLESDRMTPILLPNFRVGYSYRDPSGERKAYIQEEIFQVRGYAKNIIAGMRTIAAMRESLGLTIALETFGAQLFSKGTNYSAVYEMPGALGVETYDRLKADLAKTSGWNSAHSIKILEQGMKFNKTSMTADEAQFLLSRKFQISEIARWFHVPPHLLGDLEKATFSNIEQQSLEFVIYTMVPWFVRWEQRINATLMQPGQPFFAEFVVDGLVRGDIKTRYEAYKSGIEAGWLTRNEARIKESLNTAEGLDRFLVMQNMAEVDEAGNILPINKPPANNGNGNRNGRAMHFYQRLLSASVERVVRKESAAIIKALTRFGDNPAQLQSWAEKFYNEHAEFLAEVLQLQPYRAKALSELHRDRLLISVKDGCLKSLIEEIERDGSQRLIEFVQQEVADESNSTNMVAA